MSKPRRKIKIGILGCGAIGSGIAKSVKQQLKAFAEVSAVFDVDQKRAKELCQILKLSSKVVSSVDQLANSSDIVIEAINSPQTKSIIHQIVKLGKDVLVMSVGKMLDASSVFATASQKGVSVLIPSGAIAGIDAFKAGSLVGVKKLSLITRKPVTGFKNDPYLLSKGIDLSRVKTEKVVFEGNVKEAVKAFPRNINVAATLALATSQKKKLVVKIVASAKIKRNTHQIEMEGDFGKITTTTENVICPDNPKTSYLAVLSGIQTLKQYVMSSHIGT